MIARVAALQHLVGHGRRGPSRARVCRRRAGRGPASAPCRSAWRRCLLASRSPGARVADDHPPHRDPQPRVARRVVGALRDLRDERLARPGASGSARAARRRPPMRRRRRAAEADVAASACLAVACASNFSFACCIVSVNGMPAAPRTKSWRARPAGSSVSSGLGLLLRQPAEVDAAGLTPCAIVGSGRLGGGAGCGILPAAGTAASRAQRIATQARRMAPRVASAPGSGATRRPRAGDVSRRALPPRLPARRNRSGA